MPTAPQPISPLRQRFRPLWWLAISYVLIGALTRIVLLFMVGGGVPHNPLYWAYAFGVGLSYDLIAFIYLAWPLVLYLWLVPERIYVSRLGQWLLYIGAAVLLFGLLFVAASELVFWGEFGTRFNFIAVDYLVYTTEVIGNIRESYPLGTWISLLALATLVVVWLSRSGLKARNGGSTFLQRGKVVLVWLLITVVTAVGIKGTFKDHSDNAYVNELAGNGVYEFVAAFRSSHLDYSRFYRTLPDDEAFKRVRELVKTPEATYVSDDPHDLTREIRHTGPEKHLNVVLISVESLSADYLKEFGDKRDITPNLDALIDKSMFFDNLYANGTRTVRGLEALSLSVPPTPGDSIVKAHNNENLFSAANVFNDRGYQSDFVYGGYGYFDNMNYFFAHNGYRAVDRNDIAKGETIHHENVWGVADEDLYTLALKQMDEAHAQGKPFFLHIMTTSNHRPFTVPANRVPEKNGTREAAVAYTDWSIADFLKRAQGKPYFDDTVFVITADHCASSAGRTSVPINRYHIPLWIYSPKNIPPQRVTRQMGQVDIIPTLMGLLNFSYRSRFFGADLFQLEPGRERAFPATYEKLGYLHGDVLTVLEPQRKLEQVKPNFDNGDAVPNVPVDQGQVDDATAYYQIAAYLFKHGQLGKRPDDSKPVLPASSSTSGSTPAQP
ncbi:MULTISPECIES: sulfatase-like hydrolase/transferase [unclassified Dyella]|uniref:LTA synthase family protein n=1 Tax=unclassified Dyella TaxID=2634549 RepID=UPI000C8662ED|nr:MULTISPECIES: sulfatase-like hydrolase/transferase [unclassified Dyella]MDR3447155.1 sulfatase-like hydrolase/transferase [Dyella sp.]PMQ04787.1 Lipoteichoic acid synthase [Dyella sp. AD56]